MCGVNLDRALNAGPYRIKRMGMGIMTTAMHPSRVDTQRGFSFSYICDANSYCDGGRAETSVEEQCEMFGNVRGARRRVVLRTIVAGFSAEADSNRYVSIK
jgi:hypothetical protein